MSRVVVAGDVHLGADNTDVAAFDAFLGDLYADRESLAEVVLLGDVWDLVRRDPFGAALETAETLQRLRRLADSVPVTYILGNHDVHLREMDGSRYDIDFREDYEIDRDGTRVLFRHGNEFDVLQSDRLSSYLSGPGDRGDVDPTRGRKDPVVAKARDAVGRLKTSLRADGGRDVPSYPRRERRAHRFLASHPADKLVFGHTHAPYVHHDNLAANPGSWKTTAPVHNAYVTIVDGELTLHQYRVDGTDERLA